MAFLDYNDMWETIDEYGLTFDCEIPQILMCIICTNVLRNAKQMPCGCKVCSKCLNIYILREDSYCPGKSEDCKNRFNSDLEFQDDNYANKEVSKLTMKCIYDGCGVSASAGNMRHHISICDFFEQVCEKCGFRLLRRELTEHLINTCDETVVPCEYCGVLMNRKLRETVHYNINDAGLCDLYTCICPYGCEVDSVVEIKKHFRECTKLPLICPYRDIGCVSELVPQMDMKAHLCGDGYSHSGFLLQTISNLENEIHGLEETDGKIKSRILSLEAELANLTLENERLLPTIGNVSNDISLMSDNDEQRSLAIMISKLSDRVNLCDVLYERKYSEYVWKITGFRDLFNQSKNSATNRVTSDQFLTSKNGYKLELILFPIGSGRSKNRHMSLFYQFIKDKYDELLEWPFKQNVELTLLDQGGTNHHSVHIFFDPTNDEMLNNYQRPLSTDIRMYGASQFVSLAHLSRVPGLTKNDTIFIKFSAKPVTLTDL